MVSEVSPSQRKDIWIPLTKVPGAVRTETEGDGGRRRAGGKGSQWEDEKA